ncbi:hypothetical protein DIE19_34295 [Burkholderia sp. Bp9126]|nr:hypothetical protein DIE19_34295 [Burkholderia sp. Bp9126]
MSLSATFTFALQYGGTATFYVREGGHPSSAAMHLLAAHVLDAHGSLADKFHRANEAAELTSCEFHKDLSYRYAVDLDGYLLMYRRDSCTDEWERICFGHYAQFINGYAPARALGDGTLKLIRMSRTGDCREWVTRGQLVSRYHAAVTKLASHRERFPDRTDSIAGYQGAVAALSLALQRYTEGGDFE